ncbi:MAG: hypothetical protein CMK07_15710 [Ponticaulis sp.]|nr:hypothetical protein [Ponticaulis sp.]
MPLKAHDSAGWEIRPHTREDRDGIRAVYHECLTEFPWHLGSMPDPDRLEYALRYTTTLVACEKSAGVVGFSILNSETGYLSHLFVLPDWRFCGIGSGLMQVGKVLSIKPLCMELDLRNFSARSACAAIGWREMAPQGTEAAGHIRLILE